MTHTPDSDRSMENALANECLQSVTISPESNEITGIFSFTLHFPGFGGHFPGHPVLPAVAQLAAVRILASRGLMQDLQLKAVQKAKFKNMIHPEETIRIHIRHSEKNKSFALIFKISNDSGLIASGELLCLTGEKT
jgi:3-hydroxyacyl-[acyl-carrier-protein] dehydratase